MCARRRAPVLWLVYLVPAGGLASPLSHTDYRPHGRHFRDDRWSSWTSRSRANRITSRPNLTRGARQVGHLCHSGVWPDGQMQARPAALGGAFQAARIHDSAKGSAGANTPRPRADRAPGEVSEQPVPQRLPPSAHGAAMRICCCSRGRCWAWGVVAAVRARVQDISARAR